MSTVFFVWNSIFLALCLAAAFIFPGSWKKKILVLLVCTGSCLIVFFGVNYSGYLPLFNVYLWLMVLVPLVFICLGLLKRKGLWRSVGLAVSFLVVLGYAYPMIAWHVSHSSDPMDASAHFFTYLKAQSAVKDSLNDPGSAHFKGLYMASNGGHQYVCGHVNAKNRLGAFVGFTQFFVQIDEYLPEAHFVDMSDKSMDSYNKYTMACYGHRWDYIPPPPSKK